jgi:hypothetical protein
MQRKSLLSHQKGHSKNLKEHSLVSAYSYLRHSLTFKPIEVQPEDFELVLVMRQSPVRAMILSKVPLLLNRRIILASASPRRQELLKQIGLKYEVMKH